MGSSSSKASRAAGAAARQYPTRAPPAAQTAANTQPRGPSSLHPAPSNGPTGPSVRSTPQASTSKSEYIHLDASDPDFARSLRSLGPVQPNPTLSQTSTFSNQTSTATISLPKGTKPRPNPAIAILEARARLEEAAETEFMAAGRRGHGGREFLDVLTIRQMMVLRDERGKSAAEIEKALGLKPGSVERLGPKEVVQLAREQGKAQKQVQMV